MNGRERLNVLFADRERLLHSLMASDADFATICEDYCLAVDAEELWRSRGSIGQLRATEFAEIAHELATEISAILDKRHTALTRGVPDEQTKE